VPWSDVSFKEVIWRQIQEAMIDKESTTDMSTTDPNAIYDVLIRHFAQHMGVALPPWPDRFSQIPPEDQTVEQWLADYGPVDGEKDATEGK
jgi:hypothetical protein